MIRITAKRDGFRRAGMAHSKEPKEYPDGTFTDEQLEQLKAEPMLVVEMLEDANDDKPLTAKELAAKVMEANSLEEIDALLEGTKESKTVKDAAEKRGRELAEQASKANNEPAAETEAVSE